MSGTEPLLSKADEKPPGPPTDSMKYEDMPKPTKSELDLELKMGKMTKAEMMMFFANPNNWPITILLVCVLLVIILTAYKEFQAGFEAGEAFWKVPHYFILPLGISFGGLVFATYYTFLAKQLQELVDRFRALNKKLEKNVTRLENSVNELQETSEGLKEELQQFTALRDQLEAFAKDQNTEFKAVFEKMNGVVNKMEETTRLNQVQILQQLAQGLEFLDDEEGISRMEWKRFVSRVPKQFKPKIEAIDFESICEKDQEFATFDTLNDLIQKVVSKGSLPDLK